MTERATAQLEIDYLREQLKQAQEKLKDVSHARKLLENNGFFTDNLWHVDDVKLTYQCTDEQAQEILSSALTADYTISLIFDAIDAKAEDLNLKSNDPNHRP